MAHRARITVDRLRVGIMIDGHQTTYARREVAFDGDRPGRVAVRIGKATLFFRPDRPADCRWLTRHPDQGQRLPLLGLEGAPPPATTGAPAVSTTMGAHPAECEWTVRSRTHGIVRRVCRYCNAVSIDLTGSETPAADPYAESATKSISSAT